MKTSSQRFLALVLVGCTLVAAPATRGVRGPPEEALNACRGVAEGAQCGFSAPHRDISGRCVVVPSGQYACVPNHPPPHEREMRVHTQSQVSSTTILVAATESPVVAQEATISIRGTSRILQSNGIPGHDTGKFPNTGNPNRILAQTHRYAVSAQPALNDETTPLKGRLFGIAINGVPFDPGAAEFYLGEPSSGWQYEALSGAVSLGIDAHYAHVQPTGTYHYHGLPTGLLASLDVNPKSHSALVGWAADGFPRYALFTFHDPVDPESDILEMRSSYVLKTGARSSDNDGPGGTYDGTFIRDYRYDRSVNELDECNGRFGVTPEFPQGTYAYFLTRSWPVVPRCWKGTPSNDFNRRRPERSRGASSRLRRPTSENGNR